MITLLLLFGMAVIAIEIAYHSSLSYDIKQFLYLSKDLLPTIQKIGSFKFWYKFLPKYIKYMAFIPAVLITIYGKIIELIHCEFCTATWLGFLTAMYLGNPVVESIGYAGITIFFVYIIQIFQNEVES